jgi:pre-mRNA-splicing factor CWC26
MNRDIIGILHEVLNIVKKFKMAAVSKQEYLKRYLSNADSGEKKKRKKKVKVGVKTGKSLIIDDDVNLRDIKVRQDSETGENLLDLADETPLIFNETGTTVLSKDLESIKKKEDEKKAMWAPVKTFQDEIPAEKRDQNAKDLSPRRSRVRHDSSSPERNSIKEKLGHSEDLSPRLRTRHDSASDQSPPRRTRHDSSSDQSPPRNKPTATQQRKTRHDSVDLSPPRRGNKRLTSPDQSPPRRHRHDSSSDQYPPRIARPSANRPKPTRHDSPDLSLPRKTRGSPPDQSPPRRQSAKRAFKGENDNDQSPPRKQKSSGNVCSLLTLLLLFRYYNNEHNFTCLFQNVKQDYIRLQN